MRDWAEFSRGHQSEGYSWPALRPRLQRFTQYLINVERLEEAPRIRDSDLPPQIVQRCPKVRFHAFDRSHNFVPSLDAESHAVQSARKFLHVQPREKNVSARKELHKLSEGTSVSNFVLSEEPRMHLQFDPERADARLVISSYQLVRASAEVLDMFVRWLRFTAAK